MTERLAWLMATRGVPDHIPSNVENPKAASQKP
jgi:hypothetical protein